MSAQDRSTPCSRSRPAGGPHENGGLRRRKRLTGTAGLLIVCCAILGLTAAHVEAADPSLSADQRALIETQIPDPNWPRERLFEYYEAVRQAERDGEEALLSHALEVTWPRHTEHELLAWAAYRAAWKLSTLTEDLLRREQLLEQSVIATESIADPVKAAGSRYYVQIRWVQSVARRDADAGAAMAEETIDRILEEQVGLDWIPEFEEEVVFRAIIARDHDRLFLALERAELYARDANDWVIAKVIRGRIAEQLGQMEVAARAFIEADKLSREVDEQNRGHAVVRATSSLISFYLATGRHEALERRARELLEDQDLFRRFSDFDEVLWLHLGLCALYAERRGEEPRDPSADCFRRVIDSEGVSFDTADPARIHLALVLAERGEYEEALERLDSLEMRTTGFNRAREGIARALILERGGDGSPNEAARCLEDYWFELSPILVPERIDQPARRGFGPLHYDVVRRLHSERMRLAEVTRGTAAGAKIALEILLELERSGTLQAALGAPRPTLEAIREALIPPGGGIAYFFPAPTRTHLLLVDESQVTHLMLDHPEELREAREDLQRLQAELPDRPRSPTKSRRRAYDRAASRLSSLLVPPPALEVIEGWSSISVIGLDLLRVFPLAELRTSDRRTLGSRMPISVLPSASVGLALARRAETRATSRSSSGRSIVVHSPILEPSVVERFPQVTEIPDLSSRWIEQCRGSERAVLIEGRSATLREIERACADENALLQFLCHGASHPQSLEEPVLLLAGEQGAVTGADFEKIQVPPLVIATACGSGLSAFRSGDPGTADLLGGFLVGGADAVILSFGDISYRASLEASELLHSALECGRSPAESLMELHRENRDRDPTIRSSLVVVGLGHAPLFEAPRASCGSRGSLRWLAALAALTLIGAYGMRAVIRRKTESRA